MDRNYCLIVFIVYMSYSDTWKVAKCCLYEKKSMLKKNIKIKKMGGIIGSCPQGLGASEKKKKKKILYNTTRGGELTCFHFFKSSC